MGLLSHICADAVRNVRSYQGGVGIAKKDRGSFFLEMARSSGLGKYVIRGISIFGRCTTIYGLIRLGNLITFETTNDDKYPRIDVSFLRCSNIIAPCITPDVST
jgi:hypothetical protein